MDKMNISIIPSRRIIQAECISYTDCIPAAPKVPQFIDIVVERQSVSDFSFVIACFAAIGVGGLLGTIINFAIKIF